MVLHFLDYESPEGKNFENLNAVYIRFFKKDFTYLFVRDRERERERERGRDTGREKGRGRDKVAGLLPPSREKQAPCREPDVGLDSQSPGSGPELKVALNH